MLNIIIASILSFLITFFAIPVIIQVAKEKKLFDEPGERKIHKTVIPTLGGLGIFAGFIFSLLICLPTSFSVDIQYLTAAFIVIFFLGMKDDVLVLSVSKKFIGQIIAAAILIRFGGISINNMHGFLNIYELPQAAGNLLTLFTITVITNSFNLIDGIDGLAGSLGLLTTSVLGTYFMLNDHVGEATLAFTMAGSLLGFLIYNFSPAKIFMGDTGSLLLGLLNAILVIKFINFSSDPAAVIPIEAAPAIGFAVLIIPLFDTLRVFALRILYGRSPFKPDRNHIHHIMLDLGLTHRQITIVCFLTNGAFIALAYSLRYMGTTLVIAALLLACFLLSGGIQLLRMRSRTVKAGARKQEIIQPSKILTFASEPMEID